MFAGKYSNFSFTLIMIQGQVSRMQQLKTTIKDINDNAIFKIFISKGRSLKKKVLMKKSIDFLEMSDVNKDFVNFE